VLEALAFDADENLSGAVDGDENRNGNGSNDRLVTVAGVDTGLNENAADAGDAIASAPVPGRVARAPTPRSGTTRGGGESLPSPRAGGGGGTLPSPREYQAHPKGSRGAGGNGGGERRKRGGGRSGGGNGGNGGGGGELEVIGARMQKQLEKQLAMLEATGQQLAARHAVRRCGLPPSNPH